MAKAKFPKTLYVRREDEGGESWLSANDEVEMVAEISGPRTVGVYKLVKIATVKTKVKLKGE
jgi:hypothetical protein